MGAVCSADIHRYYPSKEMLKNSKKYYLSDLQNFLKNQKTINTNIFSIYPATNYAFDTKCKLQNYEIGECYGEYCYSRFCLAFHLTLNVQPMYKKCTLVALTKAQCVSLGLD